MPDQTYIGDTVATYSQTTLAVPSNRPPINPAMGPHQYQESEFPEGAGHCDTCGGGPDAPIHQPVVDPLVRIAKALERIGDLLEILDYNWRADAK